MNKFIVRGEGSFPYCMLQRGRCYPARDADVDGMFNYKNSRSIHLIGESQNHDLWRSFGWSVISHPPVFPKDEYEHYHTWPC